VTVYGGDDCILEAVATRPDGSVVNVVVIIRLQGSLARGDQPLRSTIRPSGMAPTVRRVLNRKAIGSARAVIMGRPKGVVTRTLGVSRWAIS